MKNDVEIWCENVLERINNSSNPCEILIKLVEFCMIKKLTVNYPLTINDEIQLDYCKIFSDLHDKYGC